MQAAICNENAGAGPRFIWWRWIALAGVVSLLSGCEAKHDDHVVYSSYAPEPVCLECEVVDVVYVETYFEVVDEYGQIVEEVEVTWEYIDTCPVDSDCGCGDSYHYYCPFARNTGARRRIDVGASATTMPVHDRDKIVFRFRKSGYVDTWVAASDMKKQDIGGRIRLERKIVLRPL